MMYVDLIVLVVIISLISVWLDRRYVRNKKDQAS